LPLGLQPPRIPKGAGMPKHSPNGTSFVAFWVLAYLVFPTYAGMIDDTNSIKFLQRLS